MTRSRELRKHHAPMGQSALLGDGIPTTTHELLVATVTLGGDKSGQMGETFVRLDPAVVDELVKIAGAGRTPKSVIGLDKAIRDLVGHYLYPVLAHRDDEGDFIITATDGERGNA